MAYEAGSPTATRPEPVAGTITVPEPVSIPESRAYVTAADPEVAVLRQGGPSTSTTESIALQSAWDTPVQDLPRILSDTPSIERSETLPDLDDSTPLALEVAEDTRRRLALAGRRFPRPPHTRVDRGEPEGWGGQDHHDREHRGRAGPVRPARPRHRHRPAGQREHRAGHRPPCRGAERLRRAGRRHGARRGRSSQCPDIANLWCAPATIDLAGAEIELVSLVARETRMRDAPRRYIDGLLRGASSARLRPDRLPAQPRAAHGERVRRRRARCSSRSSASTTPSRDCPSCSRTSS